MQARLEHATAVGEQQRRVEEEERAKMASLAERMANEAAQQEGEACRRHEAAMSNLALQREHQVGFCVLDTPSGVDTLWSGSDAVTLIMLYNQMSVMYSLFWTELCMTVDKTPNLHCEKSHLAAWPRACTAQLC